MSILIEVNEESTLTLNVTVIPGGSSSSVTPTAFTWTLTDRDGAVINSRTDVVVTPSDPTAVILTGDDLAIIDQTKSRELRIVTVKTDEGSSAKPQIQEKKIWVKNLTAIT